MLLRKRNTLPLPQPALGLPWGRELGGGGVVEAFPAAQHCMPASLLCFRNFILDSISVPLVKLEIILLIMAELHLEEGQGEVLVEK